MRHSNHATREYGRKNKKAESRTLRARDKRAAITESREDADARHGNERLAVRELALEIVRQGSMVTMAEAVTRARKELGL